MNGSSMLSQAPQLAEIWNRIYRLSVKSSPLYGTCMDWGPEYMIPSMERAVIIATPKEVKTMWKVGDIAWHIWRNQEVEITHIGGWPTEKGCDCSIHVPGCLSSVRDGDWSTHLMHEGGNQ